MESQVAAAPAAGRPGAGEAVLEARDLTKRYGDRAALAGVSLAAGPGERVAIIGPNGAGKTTLLSILARIQRPDAGAIVRVPERIGWVPQRPAVYGKLTVAENLRLFARLEGCSDVERAVGSVLSRAGLSDRAGQRADRLSGGNRQRLNVAVGLVADPSLLLLDEPTAALDPRQRERLWEFVLELGAGGTAVVFSTHDVVEAERHAHRILVLADGEPLFTGSPGELVGRVGGGAPGLEAAFVAFLRDRGH